MAYNPGVTDRSGELLGAGISRAGSSMADAIRTVGERKQESEASDAVMDFIMRSNPELLPKGPDGQPDPKVLEKFFNGNLGGKQKILGLIVTQMLTPLQKAQVGYYEAQTDVLGTKGAPVARVVNYDDPHFDSWAGGGSKPAAGGGALHPLAAPFGMPWIPGGMPLGPITAPPPPLGVLPPLTGRGSVSSANRAALTPPPPLGLP